MRKLSLGLALLGALAAYAGDAGGNGGDVYVDEFKAYRGWFLRILKGEQPRLEKELGISSGQYTQMMQRFSRVSLIRKGRPDVEISIDGKKVLAPTLLNKPVDKLFRIEGEPKMAVSIAVGGADLAFFDEVEWDKLTGKTLRKLKLVGHELFTFADLEGTGDNRFTQHFDEALVRKYPFSQNGEIPMVPLWSIPFSTEIEIRMTETCHSPGPQAVLKRMIGEACRPQLPTEVPSPFYAYECLFDGDLVTPVKERYEVSHYVTTGYVPGTFSSVSNRGSESYYNNSFGSVTSFYRSWDRHWKTYRPGHTYFHETIVSRPVWEKFCRITGTLTLIGVDPMTEDTEQKLLMTSQDVGTWNEMLIGEMVEPQEYCRSQCFEFRKRLPKGLVNSSQCRILSDEKNHFRWELWGVFPYRSQPNIKP